ncbi:MAG TPA: Hsp70 family protein [Ramlibacter sp.]|nr:Hsp70 family protein [Ramlibacter sp.]
MILGIDLGTTNSLITCLEEGRPRAIRNALGQVLTPSVVSVDDHDVILVGQAARERSATRPGSTAASFKRLMGSREPVQLGKHSFRPEDLSAMVLRALKADAEADLGCSVHDVVISVPAYFNDGQRKATRLAGELAGLNVRRLVNEPTAAALFHGIQDYQQDARFLVFDLGGGTFDVSILERFSGMMEVRATGGDSFLGGDDFTAMLQQLVEHKADLSAKEQKAHAAALRFAAEGAKRALAGEVATDIALPPELDRRPVRVSQEEYERACQPLLDRLRAPVERALRDARLRAADLDEIVLVGGATRMPAVRRLAAQMFGRIPARHPDPDQTVALGAAVCAGLVARDAAFEEIVMTDVCPHSLGTRVTEDDGRGGLIGDVFLPIIERNTVVPASRERSVCTVRDNQSALRVDVFQGESRLCSQNVHLGGVEFPIPARKAGEVAATIRYTYDVNGILDVDIVVDQAGISRNLVIKQLAGDVPEEEITRRRVELAALKVHPRAQEENRVLVERANRLYQQLLGDEREQVGRWLSQFLGTLERQDPRAIVAARAAFAQALDTAERGNAW